MTFKLSIYQFIRSKEVRISLLLILLLGLIGVFIGKRHIIQQEKAINEVTVYQKDHFERYVHAHNDDLGLLLYYIKFAFINPSSPLSGISIGQSDVNPSIERITIKTLEAQKHDTDLINPMNLQSGNLDLSFVLIYLFPLLIIVLVFNVLSEETDTGTWSLISIQTKSNLRFIINKLWVRFLFVTSILVLLFLSVVLILNTSFTFELLFMFLLSALYIAFWFTLSFFFISFKKSSRFNALILLTTWLVLLILLPSGINAYVTSTYPIPAALNAAIVQRDGYHTKWDKEKLPTIQKFYAHYPQFEKYGYPTDGFNWLWYYAMQQMGDDDSQQERRALNIKIHKRVEVSQSIASWIPNMHMQLTFNKLAGNSLEQHIEFLEATERFHEKLRLFFYPKIFEGQLAESIDWEGFTPEYYHVNKEIALGKSLIPLLVAIISIILFSIPMARKI